MSQPATLPQCLLRNAAALPRRVAFREKRRGIWQNLTWRAYAELVRGIAAWLAARDFAPAGRLAVWGENRPPLYAAMLAAQALGGAAVPLHPDAELGRVSHILRDCRASVAIVEEAEQAELLLAARDRLPDLALVTTMADLGREATPLAATPVDTAIAERSAQDVALLLYPWRPDTLPRPASLTHAGLLGAAGRIAAAEDVRPADRAFAYLPLASLADAVYTQALALQVGFSCNCPEGPDTVPRDLRELGPTIVVAPARLLQLLAAELDAGAAAASPLKRRLYARFTGLAERAAQRRAEGAGLPLGLRIATLAGELVIRAPVRDRLGLGRARWVRCCDGPPAPELARRFAALGVCLRAQDDGAGTALPAEATAYV